jgi:hypothetical protein
MKETKHTEIWIPNASKEYCEYFVSNTDGNLIKDQMPNVTLETS